MKKNKIIYSLCLLSFMCIVLLNFVEYKIHGETHSYSNTQGQEFIRNLNLSNKDNNYKEIPYPVDFIYKNNNMSFKESVLYKNNRIYISISDFIKYFTTSIENEDGSIIKIGDDIEIDTDKKIINKNDKEIQLRGDLFNKDDNYYMSLFDLCVVFNLNTYWDYDNNKIYFDEKIKNKKVTSNEDRSDKKGYIRFEDFTAGDVYLNKGSLEKVRLITDYMKINNESFSISWVPRYINNDNNIDNDISEKESMINANFVFTLDYIINNGGNIGLHGYTHQYNNTNSISGVEFGKEGCNNLNIARERVEKAIIIANKLNIPISYWETPHYKTTEEEQRIFEEYFNKIYEPAIGIYNKKIIVSKNNQLTKYIPTPLGYVDDDNGEGVMERMKNVKENEEFSLFYHLSIEIKSIDISINDDGHILYKYDNESVLKNIVKLSRKLGYRFNNINDI